MTWPTDHQITELAKELRGFADFLESNWHQAARNAKNGRAGFPSSSMAGKGGIGGHSDPVLRLVESGRAADPAWPAVNQAATDLLPAMVLVRRIRSQMAVALPTASAPEGRTNSVAICLTCPDPAPRPRRGLCNRCYTQWCREGRPELAAMRPQAQAS